MVIAASIVEKEGYFPVNMPRVARTILNRLARGGGLQMDSTVLYALGRDGGTVTPADLRTRTPYNTYLHAGLTPTPICVVSMTALRAMLNPPPGPWLYFVVIDRAGHDFVYTLAEPVDAAGELRNGQRFQNIQELKEILAANPRQLARNLLHQFTLYATGTPVRFADRVEIEEILDRCAADGYRVRDLLHAFVRSRIFLGQKKTRD